MKPPLPRILTDVPRTLHAQLEVAKAIRTLSAHSDNQSIGSPVSITTVDPVELTKGIFWFSLREALSRLAFAPINRAGAGEVAEGVDVGREEREVSSRIKRIGGCVVVITTCPKKSSRIYLRTTS
jgi:hypothetical protein